MITEINGLSFALKNKCNVEYRVGCHTYFPETLFYNFFLGSGSGLSNSCWSATYTVATRRSVFRAVPCPVDLWLHIIDHIHRWCQFFEKRGYPVSVVKAGHHRAQQFDRQSSLQTSQKDKNDRIPFTLTFHPHNHAVKSIILSNFKLLQNDPETGRIFSQPPLISFKRDQNVGNFLVRSALKTNEQPGTFKCARSRCKTCLFIVNTSKISGPKRSVKITDRFTCTSANVIYCITCTLCNKLYIGETGRRLGDRFREHLRDVEKNDKDAAKPVARHFNLPNHSKKHMAICGLSLHLGTTESRKNLEQKFIFQIGTLNPHGINERFSFN